MARAPLGLTPAQKAELETLAAVLSAEQIADYFGIGRTTFFAMVGRDAEIAERYKRGKARAIGAIAQSLIGKARGGDTACMIFFLKTQAGWRETAPIAHPAVFEPAGDADPDAPTPALDRLRAMIERIAEREGNAG